MSGPSAAGERRPTVRQTEALRAVAAGRVTYGDPHPRALARRHARLAGTETRDIGGRVKTTPTTLAAYANPTWLVDGAEVYRQQHTTYASLSMRGWVDAGQRDDCGPAPVTLTEAGAASLGAVVRPRERGVRRRKRDATMDATVVEQVEQLAAARYGGNYSAALQAAVERGLADLEPLAERVARFDADFADRLEHGRTDA